VIGQSVFDRTLRHRSVIASSSSAWAAAATSTVVDQIITVIITARLSANNSACAAGHARMTDSFASRMLTCSTVSCRRVWFFPLVPSIGRLGTQRGELKVWTTLVYRLAQKKVSYAITWRRVEQFTVVCHIIAVTVDFQTTFEDVLVCDLVLMALLTLLFLSLSTEHVVCYVSLQFFGLNATLIFSLIIIIVLLLL